MVKFIGDIHGDWEYYNHITETTKDTIQVGDFGCGFEKYIPVKLNHQSIVDNNHQMFRGNHDDPAKIKLLPNYIEDGTFDKSGDVFCIGGAESIDKNDRIEGVSWWPDEELSMEQFYSIMDKYEAEKPDIVATHDCPIDVYRTMDSYKLWFKPSRTSQALSSMFYIHKPKIWVFGHHHIPFDKEIDGTRFICCDINQIVEI